MTTVNFVFSTESEGAAVAAPLSLGTVSNTGSTNSLGIYISHDAEGDLSACGMYIQPYAGAGYVGLYGASPDYIEILGWGTWGTRGLLFNMDASDTSTDLDIAIVSGTGSKSTNSVILATEAFLSESSTEDGHFPEDDEAHMTLHMAPPPEATNVAIRQFTLFMYYEQ